MYKPIIEFKVNLFHLIYINRTFIDLYNKDRFIYTRNKMGCISSTDVKNPKNYKSKK